MDGSLSILVIDDSEDDRLLYQRTLKKISDAHYTISEAENGEAGLAAIMHETPSCVLLDYSLPGHNGIEVLKRIREIALHLPVIMLTGQGNEAIAVQSMKEGAQDYIVKSAITPESLQRVVRVAIEHSVLQKRIYEQRTSLEIFTRALAHDLKEPVRTIRSFLERITDWRTLSEKSQKSFVYITKAADRMAMLIDNVFLYTRLDSPDQIPRENCELHGVVEEVKENLATLIQERSATITYDALPVTHTNRVQMIQLFQNLIANAIRHCDNAVTVHVSASEHEHHWQLAVRDNGPGIAPEYLEKIFDPFKRLSHRKEDGPGLGLGLAINRKIMESHGGKIWCESELGKGTTFLFALPKATSQLMPQAPVMPAAAPAETPVETTPQSLARLLLVDDNEADLELNRIMLIEDSKLNCEVLTASNGREAIQILKQALQKNNPIDLLLVDINMPGISGFELLAQMQQEASLSATPVIMCSTSAYDVDKTMSTTLGAAGYMTKPPQFPLLKEIIDRCGHLRLSREAETYVLRRVA